MGMRQNVAIKYSDGNKIYFYSHWDGESNRNTSPLADKVRTALNRKLRWDDESYLARIIFCEIVKEHIDEETGFGIQPYEVDPEFPTIEIDMAKQTVNGLPFQRFIDIGR